MVFKFQNGGLNVIGTQNAKTNIAYSYKLPESNALNPYDIDLDQYKTEQEYDDVNPYWITPKSELPKREDKVEESTESTTDSAAKSTTDTYSSGSWDDNLKSMTYWLRKNSNFNDVQIAGLLACLSNESSLKTNAVNQQEMKKWGGDHRAGRGLAQWSLDRNLAYSNWHNKTYGSTGAHYADNDDLATQLSFVLHEMNQRPAFMRAFMAAKTPEQAADAVRRGYENGSANALATTEQMNRYVAVGSPSASDFYSKDKKMADKIYNHVYPACEMVQWTYCQAHPVMYIPDYFSDDRIHPNDEGMRMIADEIFKNIML